jgi:hypothetical protein
MDDFLSATQNRVLSEDMSHNLQRERTDFLDHLSRLPNADCSWQS